MESNFDEKVQERAVLVGLNADCFTAEQTATAESLEELEDLLETAGGFCTGKVLQNRHTPDSHSFIGEGKAQEVRMLVEATASTMVIFDNELSPGNIRALEEIIGVTVLDRSALILDIFAQRARSSAGKLQVELAQLKYNLPRLGGQGLVLSRLGGGIGTRGPGETKLEMDRRRIRGRIHDLTEKIDKLKAQRQLHRIQRKNSRVPVAALVGYTNAGKSTILNALAGSNEVMAEDLLFATLDPTTRLIQLDDKQEILLTDTVGFIQKLPHTLVSAFQATLEETAEADLLIHVVDASDVNYELQIQAVVEVLKEIGAENKPAIFVFNKADKLPVLQFPDNHVEKRMLQGREGVVISAKNPAGLEILREKIKSFFAQSNIALKLCIPYDKGHLVTRLHDVAKVEAIDYNDKGTIMELTMSVSDAEPYLKYEIKDK